MKPRTEVPPDNVDDVPVEPGTVSDPGPSASAPEPPGKAAQDTDAPSAAPSMTPASSLWRSMPSCWHSTHMGASPCLPPWRGVVPAKLSLALKPAPKL